MPYFGLKGGWLTFWVTVACATEMTLFGYDQGVFSGVIVTDDFLVTLDLVGNTDLISTITAVYTVGSFFGSVAALLFGQTLGRKRTLLAGTLAMTVGAIMQTAAYNVPVMIVGRVIAGIGNGMSTATAPVWQSETAKATWRGKLVIIELIMCIVGFSLVQWLNFGLSFVGGSVAWRFPLAFQLVFIIILFCTVPWLPESPRWLISKGRMEEAKQILADLEALDIADPYISEQYHEIQRAVQYEVENKVTFRGLLRGRTTEQRGTATLRRLLLGIGSLVMKELTGINVLSYYLPTVLISSVGLSNTTARLLTACNSISYLLASLVAIPQIERWGRRKLLIYGAAGQGLCYLIITVCVRFNELSSYPNQTAMAKASIAFFFLFYVFFGIGWQGVPWLYPTEINSLSMRTRGTALSTAIDWAFNYMVVQITPIGIERLHWKFYIIWTVFNFCSIVVVYLFYPETADRSLEDMDRFFRENHDVFVFRHKNGISTIRPEEVGIRARDVRAVVQEQHPETVFTRRDIYNARASINCDKLGGYTPTAALIKLFDENKIPYLVKWADNNSNRLVGLVWTFPYCLQMWKRFPEVISFDNTYNTNRFKLPLFQATGQTCLGSVYNAAFGLIDNEKREGFQFLSESIRQLAEQHLVRQPGVIITDFDDAMKAALNDQFPEAQQQLCIHHIISNVLLKAKQKWVTDREPDSSGSSVDDCDGESASVQTHSKLSPKDRRFIHQPVAEDIPHSYHGVLMMWKHVMFAETEEAHEKAWCDLCREFDDQRAILRYLHGTYMPVRAQWARCFIRKYRNFGIRVTSGTEASNNNVKSYLLNGMSNLHRLVEAIQDMIRDQERDFAHASAEDEVLTARGHIGSSSEYLGNIG
ncbi:sugar transporter [Purpureocillium lavendulum]|uniref:Sugar transporter n=2 Tax=Purpureocillium lavendulum TaxID=1247861 RepID=A0AB34FBR2_9HYPO|nr:sugar transporter [Purpureocillium lavendulum]